MKRKVTVSLAVILMSLTLALGVATLVSAGTQGSCTNSARVLVWENASTDTGDGNDNLWICGVVGKSDMRNIAHTLAGNCQAPFNFQDNWNDCISSYSVYLPSNLYRVCLYTDINYGGDKAWVIGPATGQRYNFGSTFNDKVSSMKIGYLLSSC